MKKLKRVLLYISPFHSHGVPLDLAIGAVDKLYHISFALKACGLRVDVFTSDMAAQAMRGRRSDVFDACKGVHAIPERFFADIGNGTMEHAAQIFQGRATPSQDLNSLARSLAQSGVQDCYDIVLSFFSETAFLKKIFKSSKVLFFETGLVCHQPFQQFHSFDPFGTLAEGSYIARGDLEFLVEQRITLENYHPILEKIQQGIRAFSAHYYPALTDLHGLRAKWKKIYLAVGQPMARTSDATLFPRSLDFVEHVLKSVPRDSAVLVTEHPSYPQITAAQHQYLQQNYPNYVFSPTLQSLYSASTICLPLVDAVVGISSTVLLHAHALELKTFSFGTSCLTALNSEPDITEFVASVEGDRPLVSRNLEILDVIAHYSVPMALYQSPWLAEYLERVLNAPSGRLPKIADPNVLLGYYDLRPFPNKITKPANYFQKQWSLAPLSLAEHWTIQPVEPIAQRTRTAKHTIATVLDHYAIGGTQNVIRRLVDLLPEVHWVIFVERRPAEEFPLADNCEIINIGMFGDTVPEAERKLARAVYQFHKTCPIDVFVNPMHWRAASLKAMPLIKKIVGIPVVYWEHNSFFFPMYTAKPELHHLRAEVINDVDRVILLSDYDRWHFSTHYSASRHQVIQNPIPIIETAQTLSLDKEKSVLIVGRFDPQKRMDRIPEIADAFLSAHPDWSFTVLGDGYLRKEVEAAVAKTSVADRVNFLGHQTDPTSFFRDSAIFASLSDYEGDPLTFLEAKANGLPIVSFELFQNTKLRHDVDGFYIPQGDIKGFAEKLSLLANDPVRRKAMAIEAHKHFLTFNNDAVAQDWLDLFDALIKNAPFNPRPITAPPVATLHREAVHVANTISNLMRERVSQAQKSTAPASKSAPVPKEVPTPKSAPSSKKVPTPDTLPKLVVSRALTEAKECMGNGSFRQAAKLFGYCASEMPENANLKRFLAEALLASGQRAEALQQLKLALKMKPGNRKLQRRIRKVSYPRLYFWVPDRPFNG